MIIKISFLVLAVALSNMAFSQTPPNLIGTWEAVSAVSASSGTIEKQQRRVLSNKKDAAILKLTISVQDGRAFEGETTWNGDLKNLVAGVFHADGKNLTFSSDVGVGTGYVVNDEMEYCSAGILTTKNRASCTLLKKTK
jgi:hypothetical protein